MLQFKLNHYVVTTFVDLIQRIFTYNQRFVNQGISVIEIPSASSKVFAVEQFHENFERYPIVTVGVLGGNYMHTSINNYIGDSTPSVDLGVYAYSYQLITGSDTLAFSLPTDVIVSGSSGFTFNVAWSGTGSGYGINYTIYQNYTTAAQSVASGVIAAGEYTSITPIYTPFIPDLQFSSGDVWMVLTPASSSSYLLMVDPTVTASYQYNSHSYSGSLVGNIQLPNMLRVGGAFTSSYSITCTSKNDSTICYDIIELIAQYLELTKNAQISRASGNVDGLKLYDLVLSVAGELTQKEIYIQSVRQGGLTRQMRGENDELFSLMLTVTCYTLWNEDFHVEQLQTVSQSVTTF